VRPGARGARLPAMRRHRAPQRTGCWLAALLLVWLLVWLLPGPLHAGTAAPESLDDLAQPPAGYAALPAPKALALPAGTALRNGAPGGSPGISRAAPSDPAAAFDALGRCRQANATNAPCELVWLNDERIATGAEIRARVPQSDHPLFLWRFQSPVATVYLAGSLHVLKQSVLPLPAQYDAAFASSDRLVVEVDTTRHTPSELQRRMLEYARLPDGTTLQALASPELVERLSGHLPRHGLTLPMVEHGKPALLTQQLVLSRLLALGYHPEFGVEQHYLARRGERMVLELETLESQLALLFEQPVATQLELLEDALAMDAMVEPLLADLIAAWLGGDDAAFLEAFSARSTAAPTSTLLETFQRALVEERNVTMTARIADYLATPGRYFVLVGTGHLVGKSSIVALLEARGFEGCRVRSSEVL